MGEPNYIMGIDPAVGEDSTVWITNIVTVPCSWCGKDCYLEECVDCIFWWNELKTPLKFKEPTDDNNAII